MDPKGKYLATGGSDALISIWDTNDWICVRTLDKAEHPIRSVSFSFDGAFIAAGSDEAMPIDIVSLFFLCSVVFITLVYGVVTAETSRSV